MARRKRYTLLDGTRAQRGMILEINKTGSRYDGIHIELQDLYDWECRGRIVKNNGQKSGNFRIGRLIWFDYKNLFKVGGGVLVDHLRSLVRVSGK